MAGLAHVRDRVAVVTGASSGIGAALARALAARGARVALVARRPERLAALATEIEAAGGHASAHACDVGDAAAVRAAAEEVTERWGPVELLVNNAGFAVHALFEDHDVQDVERMFRTNVMGAVHWIQQVLPAMRDRGEGWIVNVSSFAGAVAQPDESVYSATKFAVTALSEALFYELRAHGIHVLCVYPVLVRTEMFTPAVMQRMPKSTSRRFIEPDEFADRTLRALARGRREAFVPSSYAWIHYLRAVLPGLMGPLFARVKLGALPERNAR